MKVTIPVVGKYGLIMDQQAQELPPGAWSRAVNIRFRNGAAERIEGNRQIFTTPSITPYYIDSFQYGDVRYFIHAGTQKVFVDDGTTRTEITPASLFTGTQDDRWTGGTLNGIFILNNGVENPKYWNGNVATDLADVTAWPATTKAAVVRPFKNALIALDINKAGTRYPTMVKTSSFAVPGAIPASWDHTDATKEATEFDLGTAPLVDCMAMGDANIIYTEKDMWAQTLGGALIWSYRKIDDVGALARGCIASTPLGHVVMTPGDVILHSGQGAKSIIEGRNRRWMQNNIDSTYYKRSFVVSNPARAEVWVCFPTSGATVPNVALIWNWAEDTWSYRELGSVAYAAVGRVAPSAAATWATVSGTWADAGLSWNSDPFSPAASRLVTCSTTPLISLMDSGNTFNGTTFTSTLERTGDVQGDPSTGKVLTAIYPRIDGTVGDTLTIEGGGTMDVERGPTYPFISTYTVGSSYKADGFAFGRGLAYRFTSIGDQFFRIKSFDIEYKKAGLF